MSVPLFVFASLLVDAWGLPVTIFDDAENGGSILLQVKATAKVPKTLAEETLVFKSLTFDSVIMPIALLSVLVSLMVVHRVGSKKRFSLKLNQWVSYFAANAAGKKSNGYAAFCQMLKHPSANAVNKKLKRFVDCFPSSLATSDAAQQIHTFLVDTQEWMLSESALFVDVDEQGISNVAEGLEKFVISNLYPKLFSVDLEDSLEDQELQKHISGLRWVTFQNLGIPPVKLKFLKLAIRELQRVDNFKAPRDKLVCILNACRVINEVLRKTITDAVDSSMTGTMRPLSADDFLPLLIFTLIKANPRRLHSNVEFVSTFRHPSRLVGEDAYFLTALQSAVVFIKEIGHQQLDVTCEEFHSLYAESLASYRPFGV